MKPLFTVIVPTLNEEEFLPKLLVDLARQKVKNFEVVIVDAKSEDQTKKVVSHFNKNLNLSFFPVSKRNLSYQRNIGAEKSNGEYIIFLDADIRVPPTFTKKIGKEVKKNKFLIYMPFLYPHGGSYTDKVLFNFYNFMVDVSQNTPRPFITPGALIFQKDFFFFLGMFNEGKDQKSLYPEDHEIVLKASKSGVRAKFLPNVKVGSSLRRMKKEGKFTVIQKYIVSTLEMVTKGKLDKSLTYEMGGHLYKGKKFSKGKLKKVLKQVKN